MLSAEQFRRRLLEKFPLPANSSQSKRPSAPVTLRELWEASDLPASEFADEIAQFWQLRRLKLPQLLALPGLQERFSPRFLRESMICPFQSEEGGIIVAIADPTDTAAMRAAEIVFGTSFETVIASFEDITTILDERRKAEAGSDEIDTIASHSDDDIESLRDLASGAPVVRAFNDLLERAMEYRASDIHVEPFRAGLVVRFRIDGALRAVPTPHGIPQQALISRIKIVAGLNIAERRLPQDGAARLRVSRTDLDIRVATMPTQHGESAVIRLLPRDRSLLELSKLGLSPRDEASLKSLLAMPHGMIVITGPTGSGKTTTLATMLSILNDTNRKILTIEDPVEYEIPGINQTQVRPAIGLTFAAALRSFVRQDPDVIMVGEIRDAETASIAVHAALTGHLVLTTLHTETAAAAVPRLIDLGVESFLLRSVLRAAVAQRLVRVLCDRCKAPHRLSEADIRSDARFSAIGFEAGETVYKNVGCERCGGTGFRGRHGVFEILETNEEVRSLVGANVDAQALDKAAIESGMTTMLDDAIMKCRAGTTTVPEILRVTTLR